MARRSRVFSQLPSCFWFFCPGPNVRRSPDDETRSKSESSYSFSYSESSSDHDEHGDTKQSIKYVFQSNSSLGEIHVIQTGSRTSSLTNVSAASRENLMSGDDSHLDGWPLQYISDEYVPSQLEDTNLAEEGDGSSEGVAPYLLQENHQPSDTTPRKSCESLTSKLSVLNDDQELSHGKTDAEQHCEIPIIKQDRCELQTNATIELEEPLDEIQATEKNPVLSIKIDSESSNPQPIEPINSDDDGIVAENATSPSVQAATSLDAVGKPKKKKKLKSFRKSIVKKMKKKNQLQAQREAGFSVSTPALGVNEDNISTSSSISVYSASLRFVKMNSFPGILPSYWVRR